MPSWTPDSWRSFPARHQPEYDDQVAYQQTVDALTRVPPLVFAGEVDVLREHIAAAGRGEAFILQGGNCAESFADCSAPTITNQLKILLQMSVILTHGARTPVVRIGRIAGQYAKPRSTPTEVQDGVALPSYFGDSVNAVEFSPAARRPDPARLELAFHHSAVTLNYIRSMIDGGFADLHYPYNWNLHSIEQTPEWPEYRETVEHILDAIHFMESFGGVRPETLGRIEFYTSHEGLLLGFEQALTRRDERAGAFYNLGAHMLWIGNRTRAPDGAHVEYFRGIANPVGIKLDHTCAADELAALLERLNPDDVPGRVTLITRLGHERVADALPPLADAVRRSGRTVTWSCDPMHGNTRRTDSGRKTRSFDDVLDELRATFAVHRAGKSRLSGVHFELTGEDVTECIGGGIDLTSADLDRNYQTACDPRLNYAQSLEMAFLITKLLKS